MSVEKDSTIPQDVLDALNYSNTDEVALNTVRLEARSNISQYRDEVEQFKDKYDMGFEEFKETLESKINEEDFEEEEDLMEWKFAKDFLTYWKDRLESLEHAD